jgi:hypothetical protein
MQCATTQPAYEVGGVVEVLWKMTWLLGLVASTKVSRKRRTASYRIHYKCVQGAGSNQDDCAHKNKHPSYYHWVRESRVRHSKHTCWSTAYSLSQAIMQAPGDCVVQRRANSSAARGLQAHRVLLEECLHKEVGMARLDAAARLERLRWWRRRSLQREESALALHARLAADAVPAPLTAAATAANSTAAAADSDWQWPSSANTGTPFFVQHRTGQQLQTLTAAAVPARDSRVPDFMTVCPGEQNVHKGRKLFFVTQQGQQRT